MPLRRPDPGRLPAMLAGAEFAIGEACSGMLGNFAAVAQIPNVSATQPPEVNVIDLNLVGPVIAVRPYTHNDHYWQVYFDTNAAIVRVCKDAGWPAPTPTQINRMVQG